MVLPTNTSFAEEVKADRLKALYQITIALSLISILTMLTFGAFAAVSSEFMFRWTLAMISLVIGSLFTRFFLKRNNFNQAAWLYTLGSIVATGFLLFNAGRIGIQTIPFVFPIIIFIAGLLLSPIATFNVMGLSAIVVLLAPSIGGDAGFVLSSHQLVAIFLMFISAALTAQVTGELYDITQWALENYKKERRTNDELFEKRQELQWSLKRSEALSENLQETNEQLELAHKEAEEAKHFRGQFLANMSHELRTPLNAIIGFSETMLQFPVMYDDENLPSPYERDLNQIYNSGRQLLHVINDILDLAKVDAGKLEIHMQAVEVETLINAAMATARGLLGSKPVRLDRDVPSPMPLVWADEPRLWQVLLNLYSNAAKYTDEGHIILHVRELQETKQLEFALEDTGIGIDPEFHDQLFAEFQQAKHGGRDPRAGSGLGLAISTQLLTLMDGKIWMESTPGKGSTFYFTIHLYEGQDKVDTQAGRPKEMSLKTIKAAPEQPAAAPEAGS